MTEYLDSRNFPSASSDDADSLAGALEIIAASDLKNGVFPMLGEYARILSDNGRRQEWDGLFARLMTLFKCGKSATLDGPMIGVALAIRDADYFRETARLFGKERSVVADIEWMATSWNATFANTGLWMGKTFEPVSAEGFSSACGNNQNMCKVYTPVVSRIGRNFFREPAHPSFIQGLGLPVLTKSWHLLDRPLYPDAKGFKGVLLQENLNKEKNIPYSMTGGYFLANPGESVVPEMKGKQVFQLNYRWPALAPVYPMTRLIDELVQIADGVCLGQLVMATHHYSLGALRMSIFGSRADNLELGEAYRPGTPCGLARIAGFFGGPKETKIDYGYQNNGFFLMIDPAYAKEAYADNAFPFLRPRSGESGYRELGYDRSAGAATAVSQATLKTDTGGMDWASEWRNNEELRRKFTTFCQEPSPRADDGDVREYLQDGETILQMLQRIQKDISAASAKDDHLRHFEKLNRLFRSGVAPDIKDGLFQGSGRGYNTRFDAPEKREWYGMEEPCTGFDYYHGATLNLHLGFGDTWHADLEKIADTAPLFPTALLSLAHEDPRGPNVLNAVWAGIGRFIFPWAGKSFERISGRKLSMLLDESDDLEERYPERVSELKNHLASLPHYELVQKNKEHFWKNDGSYAKYLKSGSWDKGMSAKDKEFWKQEAAGNWVFGNNTEDSRILAGDAAIRVLDMNYHEPLPSIKALADSGPSPFVRQGYIFLGTSGRQSILEMNNGTEKKKRVFQFHYRFPMIGGPLPIGACLDEIVEIAEGLFLGQLIYSTVPFTPFHSSVDPGEYKYQLFGYFIVLDNTWEHHRRAIGFDVNT